MEFPRLCTDTMAAIDNLVLSGVALERAAASCGEVLAEFRTCDPEETMQRLRTLADPENGQEASAPGLRDGQRDVDDLGNLDPFETEASDASHRISITD